MAQTTPAASGQPTHQLQLAFRLPNPDRLKRIALSKPRRNDIFIAYAPTDGGLVRPIDEAIRQQGFDPWIDYDDILAGSSYETQLKTGVREADMLVLVLTENTFQNHHILDCLKLAIALNKLILVVARSRPLPLPDQLACLGNLHWLTVSANASEAAFDQLALHIIHIQVYVRLMARAAEWQHHQQSHQLLSEEDLEAVQGRLQWINEHSIGQFFSLEAAQPFLQASTEQTKALKQQQLLQRTQPDIFISYSRPQRETVKDLVNTLIRHGWKIWIDWENIPVAADWREEVEEGIRQAHTLLFIVSPLAVRSQHCQWELEIAQKYNKRIIPVIIDDGYDRDLFKTIGLSSIQYVSYTKQAESAAFKQLLQALRQHLVDAKAYTRLLNRAYDWQEQGRPDHGLLTAQALGEIQRWCRQRQIDDIHDQRVMMPLLPLQEQYLKASQLSLKGKRRKGLLAAAAIATTMASLSVLLTIATIGEIRALVLSLEEHKGLDGLITALKAGKQLQRNSWLVTLAKPNLRPQATTALHSATLELREMNRLSGHAGDVFDVAFSPDGRTIASVSEDQTLRVWEVHNSRSSQPSFSHRQAIVSVDYSADGDLIATGSYDGAVKLWTPAGRLHKTLPKLHQDWVAQVKFSPGGQYLVSTSFSGQIHLWNRRDDFAQPVEMSHGEIPVGTVDFSPYGRQLVTGDA
ncbi:hypothetical protein C7271_07785, partial [filamentous cyanobacterium CCP5]